MSQQESSVTPSKKRNRDSLTPNSTDLRYLKKNPKPHFSLTPPRKKSRSEKLPALRKSAQKVNHHNWGHLKTQYKFDPNLVPTKLRRGEQKTRTIAIEYLFCHVFGRPQVANWPTLKVIQEIMDRY